jgi:hypothetical protein
VASLLLLTLACGGDDDADERGAAFDRCMADAGYDGGLGDVDYRRQQDPAFDAALTRCYQEVGVTLPPAGELTRQLDQVVRAEVRCLRDKGWDVPDPVRGDHGGLNMGNLDDYVPEDQMAAFAEDDDACVRQVAPKG